MTAVLSNTLFAEPVTQVQAADLHIVGATDAADATARSVPQVTTVAGQAFGENDAIAVADTVTIDGRELTPGLWYWPVATAAADVNGLAVLSADAPIEGLIVAAEPQKTNTLSDMFDGTSGTTAAGLTYFEHMRLSQKNQILWTCRETGMDSAAVIAIAQAHEPALVPFIPLMRIEDTNWSVLQPGEELIVGTQYLISLKTSGTPLLSFQVMAEASTVSGDVGLPTAMHITSASGNQTGNGFTSNGVYRSNNTGPLNNTGFGNWTWRVKATRIGDWIQHHYWNDTANIAYRESFDGGTTWTGWGA